MGRIKKGLEAITKNRKEIKGNKGDGFGSTRGRKIYILKNVYTYIQEVYRCLSMT